MNFKNWFISEQEGDDSIKHTLDAHGLILFFKKDNEYFGAGEDGRIVFARIKNPDKDTPDGWEEEATFTACNLKKLLRGEPCQSVIGRNAIDKIKVLDQAEVVKGLKDVKDTEKESPTGIQIVRFGVLSRNNDRDQAPNFPRADEE